MNQKISNFKASGHINYQLTNLEPILLVNDIIGRVFRGNHNKIKDVTKFRKKLLECQELINKIKLQKIIVLNEETFFKKLLKVNNLQKDTSMQTVIYFRGVRPNKTKKVEFLDFHRENFYNQFKYIDHQINIHIPIKNYNLKNSMRYLENSHKIPNEKLVVEKLSSKKSGVKRFSVSHKLGLTYNPKKIISGANFSKAKRLGTKVGEIFAFSSKLLHGGGINFSDEVRFSLDVSILRNSDIKKSKDFHFSSYHKSKKHFLKLKEI